MFESIINYAKHIIESFGPIIGSIVLFAMIYAICFVAYDIVDFVVYQYKRWKRKRRRAKGEFINSPDENENHYEED